MTTTFARLGVPEPICAALAQRGGGLQQVVQRTLFAGQPVAVGAFITAAFIIALPILPVAVAA